MVAKAFAEDQTYRIDHYLGKETVQNLMVLRFANSIFEPLWNQKYIDHVQITVAEEEGLVQCDPKTGEMLGNRLGYYEGVGALRDMVQNHMLQVLCMVAMEPPWSLEPDVVRDAKVGVLHCLRPITAGRRGKDRGPRPSTSKASCTATRVPGYRKEVREYFTKIGKAAAVGDSTTETFVALQAVRRQLALGGRAVLSAHRQTAAQARQRGGHSVQGRAAGPVQHQLRAAAGADRAVAARAAGGGPVAADRLEAAGAEGAHLSGEDGVQLQLQLRRQHRRRRTNGCCST